MNRKRLLDILAEQYGMEKPSLALLREGGGRTYTVSGKAKYLLKVVGSAFLDTARQSVSVMAYLAENGFPVPALILTRNGDAAFETASGDGKELVVLMEFVDGVEPDLKECAADAGALTGRFHRLMSRFPAEPVLRGRDFFIGRYLDFLRMKQYPRLSAYEELGTRLWEKVGNLPQGNCHGDLHRGNLLQRADGQICLVDFDTVCRAPLMFDITVMCDMTDYFRLKPEDIATTKEVYRKFLSGYSEYRTPGRGELLSFPDWVAVRHFQLQATILEIHGADCIDDRFIDSQLSWLNRWMEAAAGFERTE